MKFIQLVHTLSYGDAISGEILALDRFLREAGCESHIYAINVHPFYKGRASDYRTLSADCSGHLILHYSLGSPLNDLFLRCSNAERALVYHNLTPAHWFAGVNPRIVSDIEQGLMELPELCRVAQRVIADSEFNRQEIEALGFSAQVLELPFDPQRWQEPANAGIASLLQAEGGLHLLHVGRLAPNKSVEDVIKTFYFLHHHIEKKSRLWLVGIDTDTELYSFSLKRLVRELGLEEAVQFVGCMADSELRALYTHASVYMCMSEHEGFCVPLIEAMHFGLPVIAYASSAIPYTLGKAGVLVQTKNHAALAELVYEIHSRPELREKLVSAGRARAAELSYENFSKHVRTLFGIGGSGIGTEQQTAPFFNQKAEVGT